MKFDEQVEKQDNDKHAALDYAHLYGMLDVVDYMCEWNQYIAQFTSSIINDESRKQEDGI